MNIDLQELRKPCSCGKDHLLNVKDIVFHQGAINEIPDFVQEFKFNKPTIICDMNTYIAAGKQIETMLHNNHIVILNPYNLHADEHGVGEAKKLLSNDTDLFIAVGSGTIHDITRYIAYEMNLPFFSVPTAASVDGFVSTVAAMTWHGFKKSFTAVSPIVVFADSEIYAKAPSRLTASGFSDLLGKYTALADWKLGHLLIDEYICPNICKLEEDALKVIVSNPKDLKNGDVKACENLMYGLLLSGLAMQMVGNSRPASGAEHHLSHLWEMCIINKPISAYHGEKVGVGLVIASDMYHTLNQHLKDGSFKIKPSVEPMVEIRSLAEESPKILEELQTENTPNPLRQININAIVDKMDDIITILDEVPKSSYLIEILNSVGAPVSLLDIELSERLLDDSIKYSPYIRSRLTGMRLIKMFDFS